MQTKSVLRYETSEFDVNEVCFEEGQNIPNSSQKSKKIQSVTEWCRCGK